MEEKIIELRPNGDDTEICKIDSDTGELVYYENNLTKIKLEIVPWEGSYIPNYIKDINAPEVEKSTRLITVDGMPISKTHEIFVMNKGYCWENNDTGITDYRWDEDSNGFFIYLSIESEGYIRYSDDIKYDEGKRYEEFDRVASSFELETEVGMMKVYKDGIKTKFIIDPNNEACFSREFYYEDKLIQKINTVKDIDVESTSYVFDSEGNVVIKGRTICKYPTHEKPNGAVEDINRYGSGDHFYSVVYSFDIQDEKQVEFFKDNNNSYMKRGIGFIHNYTGHVLNSDFIIYDRVEFGIPLFLNTKLN